MSFFLGVIAESQAFSENLIIRQVGTPVPTPGSGPIATHYPIEIWGSLGLLGVGFLALARSELKRFDRRREVEAQQAEKYVSELQADVTRLETELRQSQNIVTALRVRLARSEKEIELNSGSGGLDQKKIK